MNKFLIIIGLICSFSIHANDEIKIISPEKFEVFKLKMLTQIFVVNGNKGKKTEIFSQQMRDDIQWIYSETIGGNKYIVISRPMIAGAEKSRIWRIEQGKTKLIGETKCEDHQIDKINYQTIEYRCFRDDTSNPLKTLEEKVLLKI